MLRILIYSKNHESIIRKYLDGHFTNYISEDSQLSNILLKEKIDLLIFDHNHNDLKKIVSLKEKLLNINFPLTLALLDKSIENDLSAIDDFLTCDFTKTEFMKRIEILEEKRIFSNYFSKLNPKKLEDSEKFLILQAVEKQNGSKSKAAKILGISTRSIELKFRKWGISAKK